ncbi:hypothetical protein BH11BAC2_BH11BAC2_06220 [soil metagenome]
MAQKRKAVPADQRKTISIAATRKLRFKILKPQKGIIEIVNSADHGRVCTLRLSDFQSPEDAQVYAALIKLAPELLDDYLSDKKKLKEVLMRFNKKVAGIKEKK